MRLEEIYAAYRDRASFLVVYIREAHAVDGNFPLSRGPKIATPKTLEERVEVAKTCRNAVRFTMPMVIDELNDNVARDYAGHPDRLYIVGKDGRIAYRGRRGPAGFRPLEMEEALRQLLADGGVRRAWRF